MGRTCNARWTDRADRAMKAAASRLKSAHWTEFCASAARDDFYALFRR